MKSELGLREGSCLLVQDNVQERFIDVDVALGVLDETQFPEFVHEETDPGARCPNHFPQSFLR